MFWVLACAAVGGLIGFLLAGVNDRDTTEGAVIGTMIGGGIVALPMLAGHILRSLSDRDAPLVGLVILTLVVGGLAHLLFGDFPTGRRR